MVGLDGGAWRLLHCRFCNLTHPDLQNRAANTVTFIMPGKVLASIILERFGLLNLPVHPVSLARIGGAALVIAGVLVVLRT